MLSESTKIKIFNLLLGSFVGCLIIGLWAIDQKQIAVIRETMAINHATTVEFREKQLQALRSVEDYQNETRRSLAINHGVNIENQQLLQLIVNNQKAMTNAK